MDGTTSKESSKQRSSRKRSTEKRTSDLLNIAERLPTPPPDPNESFRRIAGFQQRQDAFAQSLRVAIDQNGGDREAAGAVGGGGNEGSQPPIDGGQLTTPSAFDLTAECDAYMQPLLARTGPSIAAALVTEGAIDQLDQLHGILEQLLDMQTANYRMRRSTRDVDTLIALKQSQRRRSDEILLENSDVKDDDDELEMEYNDAILKTILAAGTSATTKRSSSKKQQRTRSKSVINPPDERAFRGLLMLPAASSSASAAAGDAKYATPAHFYDRHPSLRRQSAITDIKAKVSKWTKVKAAFKWERANPSLGGTASGGGGSAIAQSRSSDSGISLQPLNTEVARYLRVPSLPMAIGGHGNSSGDSMLSAASVSSGGGGGGGSGRESGDMRGGECSGNSMPASPGTMSSASSVDDVRMQMQMQTEDYPAPASAAVSLASSPGSPFTLLPASGYDLLPSAGSPAGLPPMQQRSGHGRGSARKSKLCGGVETTIACVPEGVPLDMGALPRRPPPSPLNLGGRQTSHPDSSDTDQLDHKLSPTSARRPFNWPTALSRSRKSMLSGRNSSAPSSPSHQFEFFGGDFGESDDLSSGEFSEPCTPFKRPSAKPASISQQQHEINRKYQELQHQISLEFQMKQREWERIRNLSMVAGSTVQSDADYANGKDSSAKYSSSGLSAKPIEENLTADFKKKLHEWRVKKQHTQSSSSVKDIQLSSASPTKEADKKIDWHLWKTGQIKLEGQGLKQMPDEKDLPEDFQRKLDEWKRIKATGGSTSDAGGSSSTTQKRLSLKCVGVGSGLQSKQEFGSSKKLKTSSDDLANMRTSTGEREKLFRLKSIAEPKAAKEVVVQTTKGALKFEGISRKFTQKLYEWEKARGIGPESSTFALLHPGYRPLVVGSNDAQQQLPEKSKKSPVGNHHHHHPLLGRSMSMDSMSPQASSQSIVSQQPSSLSLNNVSDMMASKLLLRRSASGHSVRRLFGSINSILDNYGDDDDFDNENEEDCEGNGLEDGQDLDEDEEPEACIVEVEDDYVETADSLFTASQMVERQTPIYRYEQTRKEYYAGNKEAVFVGESKPKIEYATSKALKDATRLVTSLREVRHGFKQNVEHVQSVLQSLIDTVPSLKCSLQDNSERLRGSVDVIQKLARNVIDKLTELEETASSKEDLDAKMTVIDGQLNILRKTLNFVCKHTASRKTSRNDDLPAISITCEDSHAQTPPPERNIAVVSLAPTVFQGQVQIHQVRVLEDRPPPPPPSAQHQSYLPIVVAANRSSSSHQPSCSSELELSDFGAVVGGSASTSAHPYSDCDSGNKNTTTDTTGGATSSAPGGDAEADDEITNKIAQAADSGDSSANRKTAAVSVSRNPSNGGGGAGTKRKVKLRRMGSRQNSRTESDSSDGGDPPNVVLDAPQRRLKRKTSRAKSRLTESGSLDRADEAASVVPVVPSVEDTANSVTFTIRMRRSATEPDPLEILEHLPGSCVDDAEDDAAAVAAQFVVSASPNVFVQTKRRIYTPVNSAQPAAGVIGCDVVVPMAPVVVGHTTTVGLPPSGPQSPARVRRAAAASAADASKEPAPAIRAMIASYNQRLTTAENGGGHERQRRQSGSSSPMAWRSPVLERRSAGPRTPTSDTHQNVFKSTSVGNMPQQQLNLNQVVQIEPSDAAVSQLVKGVLRSSSASILADTWTAAPPQPSVVAPPSPLTPDQPIRIQGMFRKSSSPFAVATQHVATGAIQRKTAAVQMAAQAHSSATSSTSSVTNTLPRITRKYDAAGKPPSPHLSATRKMSATPAAAAAAAAASLSDRALRLRRAKEEFLKMSAGYRAAVYKQEAEVIWRKNRNGNGNDQDDDDDEDDSDDSSTDGDGQLITKSASAGAIQERRKPAAGPVKSQSTAPRLVAAATAAGGSLGRQSVSPVPAPMTPPPSATSSSGGGGGSSKFGFSSLAQKLRGVKLRRNSKELNTVTKLCRQSLMVDVPAAAAAAAAAAEADTMAVRKSGSAQQIGGGSGGSGGSGGGLGLGSFLFRRHERAEKLKKSKSISQLDGSG